VLANFIKNTVGKKFLFIEMNQNLICFIENVNEMFVMVTLLKYAKRRPWDELRLRQL
jgi:hypothetical protein